MIEEASRRSRRSRRSRSPQVPPRYVQLPWLLLATGVLAVIVWVGLLLADLPYYGLDTFDDAIHSPRGATVTRVAPGEPAERAGVQPGDYLILQNRAATTFSPPSPFLTARQRETPLVVSLTGASTESRVTTIAPTSAPYSLLVARLEAPAIAFVFWIVSLVLVMFPYPASRIFFALGQLTALMLAAGSAGAIYYPGGGSFFRLFLVLVAVVAFHFCATFPSPLPARTLTRALATLYAVALLIVVLSVLLPALSNQVPPLAATAAVTASRLYALGVLVAAVALLLKTQNRTSYLALYKQRLLITGMIVSFLPVLALSFVPELVTGMPLVEYVWTFPALVLLPVAYAYAVRQQTLSRLDLLVDRGLVYGILGILWVASYFALAYLIGRLVLDDEWSLLLTSCLLSIASLLLYNRVRTRLQHRLDRIFFGGWYDYQSVTREATATLSQASTLQQLLSRLTSITQSMRFQSAALYLAEGKSFVPKEQPAPGRNDLPVRNAKGQTDARDGRDEAAALTHTLPVLPASGRLARHLLAQNRPLRCADVKEALAKSGAVLAESEQALLSAGGLEYLLPLVSRGELRGVLALGMRQADMVLSAEDIDIMMHLASHAALAAENVGLVETLQARLAEMERIRNELSEAQRRLAENQEVGRIRLAQELHDGAVQQLLGISYQLVHAQGQEKGSMAPSAYVSANASANASANGGAYKVGTGIGSRSLGGDPLAAWQGQGQLGEVVGEVGEVGEEYDTRGYALSHARPPARGIDMDAIRHEMLSVVTQLRGLIGELRPPGLDEFGIVTAIEGYVSRLYREGQKSARATPAMPAIYMKLPDHDVELPRPIALCLFRTAQEALRNSLKHADATSIRIELTASASEVTLCVSDDGDGFDLPDSFSKLTLNDHYGLVGIAERVEWVNGTLGLDSRPGEGTHIRVTIPLPHPQGSLQGQGDRRTED